LLALGGVDDERAWQARERAFANEPALREVVVGTLAGLDSERAWRLRRGLLQERQNQLATSYELSRVLAKSVGGLSDERAWQLRRSARPLAPVAALQSLAGVNDEESWQWRRELLRKAPKVVMASLRGRTEPEAWAMRAAVADDCKEALDGLQGVELEPAWSLRESYAAVWPSTAVKSLGPLADTPRGAGLLAEQLTRFPDNISLLKHAAAIGLGLHRLVISPLPSAHD
jgi:hypothetical protein